METISSSAKFQNQSISMPKVSLVDYTVGEELVNAISHGFGTVLAIFGANLCTAKAVFKHADVKAIFAIGIFCFSLILLYTVSTLYHSFSPKLTVKRVFRVLDHCSVFLLIAGTYTPFLLISLSGIKSVILFVVIWGSCILGIVFNAISVDRFQKASAVINVIMGWAIVMDFSELIAVVDRTGVALLVAGGVAYTVGAVIYGIGNKVRYMHSVWHFFVLAGSILHFISIYQYVL